MMKRTRAPKSGKKSVCLYYHPEWEQIKTQAKSEGMSVSNYVYKLHHDHVSSSQHDVEPNMGNLAGKIQQNTTKSYKRSATKRDIEYKQEAKLLGDWLSKTLNRNINDFGVETISGVLGKFCKKEKLHNPHERLIKVIELLQTSYGNLPPFLRIKSAKELTSKFYHLEERIAQHQQPTKIINGHNVNGFGHKSVKFLFHQQHNGKFTHIYMNLFNDAKKVLNIKSDNWSPECLQLGQQLIELIEHIARIRSQHLGHISTWHTSVGGSQFELLDEYNKWFDNAEANWIKRKRLSMYKSESGVFTEFCIWYGKNVLSDRDPLTGEYLH